MTSNKLPRIVITGVGLTSPNGDGLAPFRQSLLEGASNITHIDVRHMGKLAAGVCRFDEVKWQNKKMRKRLTACAFSPMPPNTARKYRRHHGRYTPRHP